MSLARRLRRTDAESPLRLSRSSRRSANSLSLRSHNWLNFSWDESSPPVRSSPLLWRSRGNLPGGDENILFFGEYTDGDPERRLGLHFVGLCSLLWQWLVSAPARVEKPLFTRRSVASLSNSSTTRSKLAQRLSCESEDDVLDRGENNNSLKTRSNSSISSRRNDFGRCSSSPWRPVDRFDSPAT